LDRKKFFNAVRGSIFGGKLTTPQVIGTTAVLDEWERSGVTDARQLAYDVIDAIDGVAAPGAICRTNLRASMRIVRRYNDGNNLFGGLAPCLRRPHHHLVVCESSRLP
jgi:hypothetical protein